MTKTWKLLTVYSTFFEFHERPSHHLLNMPILASIMSDLDIWELYMPLRNTS